MNAIHSTWRSHLERARSEQAWLDSVEKKRADRQAARSSFQDFLAKFLAGSLNLDEFRRTFDVETRKTWRTYGFKGMSGAMVVNVLRKHTDTSEHPRLTDMLRGLIRLPTDSKQAVKQLRTFWSGVEALSQEGHFTSTAVSAARMPFLASGLWHVQDPTSFPTYYPEVREMFREYRAYEPAPDRIADYERFRDVYLNLCSELGIDILELERLCAFMAKNPFDDEARENEVEAEDDASSDSLTNRRIWLFAPGPQAMYWEECQRDGVMVMGDRGEGDLLDFPDDVGAYRARLYELRNNEGPQPWNDARACQQFAHRIQPGDIVIVKKGTKQLLGWGRVKGPYRYEPGAREYPHVRDVEWHPVEPTAAHKKLHPKTLTHITDYPGFVKRLAETVGAPLGDEEDESDSIGGTPAPPPPVVYGIDDVMRKLFMAEDTVTGALERLRNKKNIVLQGPPGVGKTYVAKRLAYALIGEAREDAVDFVQFHQSYGYEDFVQGFRPCSSGFELRNGPFLQFCESALQEPDLSHVLIIDEINRGNLSKIFGELLMLIEHDKRSPSYAARLIYSPEDRFHVPPNVHIIGTMNTADRSLAVVDYALRRRFAFIDIEPAFGDPGFQQHLESEGVPASLRAHIMDGLLQLNRVIADDRRNLGPGYRVGHSYFCKGPRAGTPHEDWYLSILDTEIRPLLEEYWFDRPELADQELDKLKKLP